MWLHLFGSPFVYEKVFHSINLFNRILRLLCNSSEHRVDSGQLFFHFYENYSIIEITFRKTQSIIFNEQQKMKQYYFSKIIQNIHFYRNFSYDLFWSSAEKIFFIGSTDEFTNKFESSQIFSHPRILTKICFIFELHCQISASPMRLFSQYFSIPFWVIYEYRKIRKIKKLHTTEKTQ